MMENKTKIDLKNKSVFITGVAGFIGSNLAKRLLSTVEGVKVVGLDNMNNYYDVRLKEARLKELERFENFSFVKGNLADKAVIKSIFEQYKPEIVVNLGAQAGVRYSITNPDAYVEANLIGFYNILEACRHSYDEGHTPVEHLVYASSSSVYGSNKKVPYSTDDKVDNPVSLYAATKKSNELMAHAYSKLYNIPSTGLRFFTVYGPAGRPDMAYFGFTNKLLKGETIQIFNYGNCKRDFTYAENPWKCQTLPGRLGRSSSPHGLALLRRLRRQDVCPPHQQRQAYFSIYLFPIQQSPSWKALHDTAPYQ